MWTVGDKHEYSNGQVAVVVWAADPFAVLYYPADNNFYPVSGDESAEHGLDWCMIEEHGTGYLKFADALKVALGETLMDRPSWPQYPENMLMMLASSAWAWQGLALRTLDVANHGVTGELSQAIALLHKLYGRALAKLKAEPDGEVKRDWQRLVDRLKSGLQTRE